MSEEKKKKTKEEKAAAPVASMTLEAEVTARINALQETVKVLEGEIRTLTGRFANRNPALLAPLKKENTELTERLEKLEKCHLGLLLETTKPRQNDEFKTMTEVLRLAAIEYFRKANINPEIWKNIAF
jgi:predicted nuclease with TOPRIM domain